MPRKYPVVDGGNTRRQDLEVINIGQDEPEKQKWVVVHSSKGVHKLLCSTFKTGRFVVNEPIFWRRHADAERWVKEGYIAELQEGLSNLAVGFTNKFIIRSRW